jgi:hypothetical protein
MVALITRKPNQRGHFMKKTFSIGNNEISIQEIEQLLKTYSPVILSFLGPKLVRRLPTTLAIVGGAVGVYALVKYYKNQSAQWQG